MSFTNKKIWGILLIILLTIVTMGLFISNNSNNSNLGAWYYPTHEINGELDQIIENAGLQFVLLSVNAKKLNIDSTFYNQTYYNLIKSKVSELQNIGVEVRLMILEDPVFSLTEKLNSTKEHIMGAIQFSKIMNIKEIHLDIEPHTLPTWKNGSDADKQTILKEFIQNINTLYDIVKQQSNLLLSLAITWWLEKNYDLSELKIDIFYKMVYGGIGSTTEDILNRINSQNHSRSFYIGIGVDEFNSDVSMFNAITDISNNQLDQFKGISIYSLNKLNR